MLWLSKSADPDQTRRRRRGGWSGSTLFAYVRRSLFACRWPINNFSLHDIDLYLYLIVMHVENFWHNHQEQMLQLPQCFQNNWNLPFLFLQTCESYILHIKSMVNVLNSSDSCLIFSVSKITFELQMTHMFRMISSKCSIFHHIFTGLRSIKTVFHQCKQTFFSVHMSRSQSL